MVFSLSFFLFLSTRTLYLIKIFHETPFYDINKDGIVLVTAGREPRIQPFGLGALQLPWWPPKNIQRNSRMLVSTAGKQGSGPCSHFLQKDTGLETLHGVPRVTVSARGRAGTRTPVSCHPVQYCPPITLWHFLWGHKPPSGHLIIVFIFCSGSTHEQKGLLNFSECFDSFHSKLFLEPLLWNGHITIFSYKNALTSW